MEKQKDKAITEAEENTTKMKTEEAEVTESSGHNYGEPKKKKKKGYN